MCCKEQEKLSEWNYRSHYAKNHVKGGHYLPETPQRTHGGVVRWVGAVGHGLVLERSVLGQPMSNRSWIHIWSRRGHARRIASLLVGLVTAEHSPL
jgi:hypothetical protein